MPPPFWVHCNRCAVGYSKELPMYLLSCSHTFCKNCMRYSSKNNKSSKSAQIGHSSLALSDKGKSCPLCKSAIKFKALPQVINSHGSGRVFFVQKQMDIVKESHHFFCCSCRMNKRHSSILMPSAQSTMWLPNPNSRESTSNTWLNSLRKQ
jgi:zinc-RING finger domain